jgi:hypothetical protein
MLIMFRRRPLRRSERLSSEFFFGCVGAFNELAGARVFGTKLDHPHVAVREPDICSEVGRDRHFALSPRFSISSTN